MKRISYWFLSTLSVLVLLFGYHTSTSGAEMASASTAVVSTGTAGTSSSTSSTSTSSPSSTSGTSSPSGATTVTGSVATTQWGPVQVKLTMSGDTITKVTVLQQPSGNPKDTQINAYAVPSLIKETKQAGTAQIDMVSGATVTSTGYIQSLQAALDQA